MAVATAPHARASAGSFQNLLASVASQSGAQGSAQSSILRRVQASVQRGAEPDSEIRSTLPQKQATAEDGADKGAEFGHEAAQPNGMGNSSSVLGAGNGAAGIERAGGAGLTTDAVDPSAIVSLEDQSTSAGLQQKMLDSFVGDENLTETAPVKASGQSEDATDLSAAQKKQKASRKQGVAGGGASPVVPLAAVQPPAMGDVAAFGALGLRSQSHAAGDGGATMLGGSLPEAAKGWSIDSQAGKPEGSQGDIRELGHDVSASLDRAIGADGSESSAQPGIAATGGTQAQQVAFAASLPLPKLDGTPGSANTQEINKPEMKINAIGDSSSTNKAGNPAGSPSTASAASGSSAGQAASGGPSQTASSATTPASGSGSVSVSGPAPGAIAGGLAQVSVQAAIPHLATYNASGSSSLGNGGTETVRGARAEDLAATARAASEEPAAGSGVNSARVIQAMGQSEMHVEMRSEEFGDISIRTSISSQQMQAQISVDHSILSQTLSTHIPMLQARLEGQYGLHASIEIDHPGAGLRGDSGGSSPHQQGSEGRSNGARGTASVAAVEGGSLAAITGGSVGSGIERSGGLDIRV